MYSTDHTRRTHTMTPTTTSTWTTTIDDDLDLLSVVLWKKISAPFEKKCEHGLWTKKHLTSSSQIDLSSSLQIIRSGAKLLRFLDVLSPINVLTLIFGIVFFLFLLVLFLLPPLQPGTESNTT